MTKGLFTASIDVVNNQASSTIWDLLIDAQKYQRSSGQDLHHNDCSSRSTVSPA
jgi:hypothetical protein